MFLHVYFMDDTLAEGWKIVRATEVRSRHVLHEGDEEPLSAHGQSDAKTNVMGQGRVADVVRDVP